MYRIWVKNVKSRLNNYTEELERLLTVPYPNYWFSPKFKKKLWDGHHHFLRIPSLKFPAGLLHIIKEYFRENSLGYEIIDERERPVWLNNIPEKIDDVLNGITLRDYQQHAILDALTKGRGIIEMPTGSGKTEVAIGIIKILGLKTIFMVHTKDILYQTVDRFKKRLGTKQIGIIGDNQFSPDNITVATVQTLGLRMKNDSADTKRFLNSFQVLFQDECHHTSAQQFYQLGMFCHGAYYRFGLSGTALRRDVLSNMKAMAVMGDLVYKKRTKSLQDEGYLSDIKIEMIDNPECFDGDENWQSIYKMAIVESEARNALIADRAAQEFKAGGRVLILVRELAHGEELWTMLGHLGVPAIFLHGAYDGLEREQCKNKFDAAGGFVLIASPIFDEGVDIPHISVLIIATGGKSEWKTIQKVGRGLRKTEGSKPLLVIDFNDGSKFLCEHSEERKEIYKKEGFL